MNILLAIDPSICDLGWALFQTFPSTKQAKLLKADNIAQPSFESLEDRSDTAAHILTNLTPPPSQAIIELPDHYSSAKGQAARNSDAILKLMFQVATIRTTLLHSLPACQVTLIPVRRWKGTQPKHITQRRILTHWNFTNTNHNICDAVGLGDWFLRKRMGYRPTR